jgi:hypothetical protein
VRSDVGFESVVANCKLVAPLCDTQEPESLHKESGCGWRIEFFDPALESPFKVWVVLVGMLTGELDDFAIAISGLFVLTASLVHHAQPIIAVVHFRVAFQQVARGGFRLIELAIVYEVHDGIGVAGELIVVIDLATAKVATFVTVVVLSGRGQSGTLSELIFSQATALVFLPAATGARIIASRLVTHGRLTLTK